MAFDGFFCAAAAHELNGFAGAKVEKIFQSSQSCFFFKIYSGGKHLNLIISASASRPILAVTEDDVARPEDPTPLCMLYRKHLQNAKLASVSQVENERIVRFDFDSADEMGYIRRKHIYAEMMGKYSNIILTSEDGRILAASSVTDVTGSVRRIMPGLKYELPPAQDKTSAFNVGRDEFLAICLENAGMKVSDLIIRRFFAFSPVTAREIAFRACGDVDSLVTEANAEAVCGAFEAFVGDVRERRFTPTAVFAPDGEGIEYSYTALTQYSSGAATRRYPGFGALLTDYFGRKEEAVNIGRYSRELVRAVNTHLNRERKKTALLKQELADCREMDKYRLRGDIVTANIYRIRQGDDSVTATDYETGNEVTVRLDASLSPAANAQRFYKRYSKMKRASVTLAEQIRIASAECDYLESVLDFISRASSPAELAEIRSELREGGYIAGGSAERRRTPASKPLSFTTADGLTVRVGRNNKQNDALTGAAAKNEIWFHIKGFHGSHVILTPDGEAEPTDRDYTQAAMLAAYYSEKRGSDNVGVDYTRVRYLKKPNGSAPGFVTYEKYYTAYVDAKDPFAK